MRTFRRPRATLYALSGCRRSTTPSPPRWSRRPSPRPWWPLTMSAAPPLADQKLPHCVSLVLRVRRCVDERLIVATPWAVGHGQGLPMRLSRKGLAARIGNPDLDLAQAHCAHAFLIASDFFPRALLVHHCSPVGSWPLVQLREALRHLPPSLQRQHEGS